MSGSADAVFSGCTVASDTHCDKGAVFGSFDGEAKLIFRESGVRMYGEDYRVSGFGGLNGSCVTRMESGEVDANLLAVEVLLLGNERSRYIVTGGNIHLAQESDHTPVSPAGIPLCFANPGKDHYEVLSEEDLRGMYRNAGDSFMWGVRDTENHKIIVAIRKQYPALLAWTLDLKAIVKKNEQLTGKAHAEHGYRLLEFFSLQAGEEKAEGYRFAYDKEGITQVCSNFLVRDGRTIYAFMCVGREENSDSDREAFRRIMETLEYA